MPCYHPIKGFRSREKNSSGKRNIVFSHTQGFTDMEVTIPCGQCIGCRLERSRQWAIRCVHEASLYENNCFITLTYSPENLPSDNSLHKDHFQKFMKRLRKAFGQKIRFFHCGEYGENFARPHYHACLFNIDFKDKELIRNQRNIKLYKSKTLEKIWPYGYSTIGDVTFESAAYVARYVTKKVTGKKALEHYTTIDYSTGQILNERSPEYVTMSRKPGIGKPWLEKYQTDVYPDDFIVLRNKKLKPPKYYNSQYEINHPDDYAKIKYKRKQNAEKSQDNNTRERLEVREFIQNEKLKQLKREIES